MSDKTNIHRGPKPQVTKVRAWTRSQTAATAVATLPKGARLLGFTLGGVASDDSGTATLSIGSTTSANEYVSAASVKTTAGAGPTELAMVSGIYGSVLTADTTIYFKYAGQNADANVGGGYVSIKFTTGNLINDDTV